VRFRLYLAPVPLIMLVREPEALSPPARFAASFTPPERTLSDVLVLVRAASVSDDVVLVAAGRVVVFVWLNVGRVDSLPPKVTLGLVERSFVAVVTRGTPLGMVVRVDGVFFVGESDGFVTLDSVVRSAVIEVRSSASRDNRIRSDVPFRVDLAVLLFEELELRALLNREIESGVVLLEDFTACVVDLLLVLPTLPDDEDRLESTVLVLEFVAIVLFGGL
jgi:hypothetical protein